MLYVSEVKGDKFGVRDTTDGVVEFYTEEALVKIGKFIPIIGVIPDRNLKRVRVVELYNFNKFEDLVLEFIRYMSGKLQISGRPYYKSDVSAHSVRVSLMGADGLIAYDESKEEYSLAIGARSKIKSAIDGYQSKRGLVISWNVSAVNDTVYLDVVFH